MTLNHGNTFSHIAINDHERWQATDNQVHSDYQVQMRTLTCFKPAGRLDLDFVSIYASPVCCKAHEPAYK